MPPPSGAFFLLPNRCTLEGDAYQPSAPEGRMLLSWFRRFALSIVFLFAMGSAALAQFPLPLGHVDQDTRAEQMRELVSKYCRLDYDGARMAPQGWPKLQSLVWWKTNPDYTQMNVISRYTVETAPVSAHGKYTITVHYRCESKCGPSNGSWASRTPMPARSACCGRGLSRRICRPNRNRWRRRNWIACSKCPRRRRSTG